MAPPIDPPIHPSIHQPIHPPIGGGVSTDFKSSNRIKISQLVQISCIFTDLGPPTPRGWGVGRVGIWGIRDDVGTF